MPRIAIAYGYTLRIWGVAAALLSISSAVRAQDDPYVKPTLTATREPITEPVDTRPPGPKPTSFVSNASSTYSDPDVDFYWKGTTGASRYTLTRSTSPNGSFAAVSGASYLGEQARDPAVPAHAVMYYKVVASYPNAAPAASDVLQVVNGTLPIRNLVAAVTAPGTVTVSWSHADPNVVRYAVMRWRNGSFINVTYLDRSARSFTDAGLAGGVTYTYRVIAHYSESSVSTAEQTQITVAP